MKRTLKSEKINVSTYVYTNKLLSKKNINLYVRKGEEVPTNILKINDF